LNELPPNKESWGVFSILNMIVQTEPSNDVEDQTFGMVISGVVMWLGLIVACCSTLNPGEKKAIHAEVSTLFDEIISRTCLVIKPGLLFDASTPLQCINCCGMVTSVIRQISLEKLVAVLKWVRAVLRSPASALLASAGTFIVHLAGRMESMNSPEYDNLKSELSDAIVEAISAGPRPTKIMIAAALHGPISPSVMERWDGSKTIQLYRGIIEGLLTNPFDDDVRSRSIEVLSSVIRLIPLDEIQPRPLFDAVKLAVEALPFTDSFLTLLEFLVKLEFDLNDFTSPTSNFGVLSLASRIGENETRILGILRALARSEDIVDGLRSSLGRKEMAQMGTNLLKSANTPYSCDVIVINCEICYAVKGSTEKSVLLYLKAVMKVLLVVADSVGHPARDLVMQTIQFLLQ
jgi:hypothetical protein